MTEGPPPLVTSISRLSMDDGPGLRSVVFFKGCPLSCSWCHNPENISRQPQLMFRSVHCVACGDCTATCTRGALGPGPAPRLSPELCVTCGRCVEACPSNALTVAGVPYPVDHLVRVLLQDLAFYRNSGGGVTFSGGEPTLHIDYLREVASELKTRGVHLTVETAGLFPWKDFSSRLLGLLDLVLFDLKLLDPQEHRHHTGCSNELILRNFERLARLAPDRLVPRVPRVPGVTDTPENLAAIAEFVERNGCGPLVLLPHNPAGAQKRSALGAAGS